MLKWKIKSLQACLITDSKNFPSHNLVFVTLLGFFLY